MMKILHLFHDVMNLYGEYANVAVLSRFLRELGEEVSVDTLSLYEQKDISGYDFYFMGAGTERRQKLVLPELMRYRDALRDAYEAGKVMLFTGNSFELLGACVKDAAGESHNGLNLFSFTTEESDRRIVGDCLADCAGLKKPIVGFMNKCSRTAGITHPFFTLRMGVGNERSADGEGLHEKNCFGTHLTGPILVKNPELLRYFAVLLGAKSPERVSWPTMDQAYETTARELQKRLEAQK